MSNPTIQFTPAQAAAIRARGGSLLVSAAAGSGKTRVLVERAVGLITDPVHPVEADSLLIMTFTNAAAAKLRADITARLLAEVRRHPGDSRLRRQQLRLQRASIGTVDAFCLHFVQQHFAALDIPPDFETADDATLGRLRQDTLAAVLETAYTDPDFRAFADLYDRGRTDDTAGAVVLELYDFTRTLPHPDRALDDFAAMWAGQQPPQDTLWGKALLTAAAGRTAGALRLIDAAIASATRDEAADRAYTAVLLDDQSKLQLLGERLQRGDWDSAVQALDLFSQWQRPGRIKGGKDQNPAAQAASELRDRAKKQVEKLRTDFLLCTAAEFEADRHRAAPLVAALVRVVRQFSQAYFEAKLEEKVLDYADYEHLTLDLLQTPEGERTPLCRTVSARYSAVLVDEYQDTNALQDAIYFSLASPEGDNLFFVGDIKQSIYRFRQADPTVFTEKQSAWAPYREPEGGIMARPATIALDANFRSAPAVIEGVNFLFEQVFSADLGGIAYGPGQRLVVGKPGDYAGACELLVLDGCTDPAADDARAIAARIAVMKAEGFLVRGGEGTRPCRDEDFCILLRSRGDFPVYEAALRAAGIPVFADAAADLLDTPPCASLRGAAAHHRQPRPGRGTVGGAAQPHVRLPPRRSGATAGQGARRQPVRRCAPGGPDPVRPLPGGPAYLPPPGPHPAGAGAHRRTFCPYRIPGRGGGHAGRRPLPGGPAGLCRLGLRSRGPGAARPHPGHERRPAERGRQPRRRGTEPSRLCLHHDGAPF